MDSCLFCKIVRKEIPAEIVYEDDRVLAFLDIHPVNPGHTLVVPKAHAETVLACTQEDACAVMNAVHKITPAILAGVSAPACNLAVNVGSVAGQVVMHYHLHIMPRFIGDGHALWHGKEVTGEMLQSTAQKIRESLG